MNYRVVAVAGVLAFALAACSGTSPSGSSGPGGVKKLTIGLIMLQGDTYFQGIQSGLEAAVKADGGSVVPALSNGDAGTEASVARNMIQAKVSAILMQPAAGDGSLATMKAIKAAGIPLICYGNCLGEATNPAIVKGVIQSDNTALGTGTGVFAAKYIKAKLGGSANVGILNCDIASACKLRKAGLKKALADAGVTANYVSDQEGYLADKATPVVTNMLSANPTINVLWAANEGGTVGEAIGVKQAGKSIPVFGTDISTQLAGYLLDSSNPLQATTGQDPAGTIKGAYQMAKNAIAGKENLPFSVELPGLTFSRDDPAAVNKFLGK